MSPSRSSSLLLFFLACACALGQETPAALQIGAQRSWVLAGRSLRLSSLALGEFGETLDSVALQWASSNPAVAGVSEDGVVSGILPGRAIIEASAAGISAQFVIWVHPARIEIAPRPIELEIGGRAALTARALDADGRALAVPGFAWFSSLPGVARIDSSGNLQALSAGSIAITARLNLPEGGVSFTGQAGAIVRARAPFRAERLLASDQTFGALSIKGIQNVSYSNDRIALTAALSNGGYALLVHENGTLRKLVAVGETFAGGLISSIWGIAINTRGDVLASLSFSNAPNAAVLFLAGKPPTQAEIERQPNRCCYCCLSVNQGALADNGDFVYGVWAGGFDELYFRRLGGQAAQIPTGDLPGLGKGVWMRDQPLRIASSGQVMFNVGAPFTNGAFSWDGKQVVRLIGPRDNILGRPIQWFDQVVGGTQGDAYARIGGSGYHMIGRWLNGVWSKLIEAGEQIGSRRLNNINWVTDGRGGAVLFDGNTDQGPGLYRFASGVLERLLAWDAPGSNRFLSQRQAFLRPDGDAVVFGPWGNTQGRVSRIGAGTETLLYESGRGVDVPVPLGVNWTALGGVGLGNTLIARTASGALARVGQNAAPLILSPGDSLADGAVVDYVGGSAAAANGDVIVQAGSSRGPRLLGYRQGTLREIHGSSSSIRFPGGEVLDHFPQDRLAVNSRGQVAAFVRTRNSNGNQFDKLILFSESDRQAREVYSPGAPAPGGGNFNWPGNIILDEQGRVWFSTDAIAGTPSLFLWDNGVIRRVHTASDLLPDGRRNQSYDLLRFTNGRLYFSSWFQNSPNALMETDGTNVRYAISHLEPTSFGVQINGFHYGGQFRVAPNGDIAYLVNLINQPTSLLVRKPNGTDLIVARHNERLGNGPWIESLLDLAWSDDGRLFLTASTLGATNKIELFLATPQ